MAIHQTTIPEHWNYFLALDDDVIRLSRYLEPTKDNFGAYSLELARIIFAAASEVDVVCKRLCKKINPKSKADNINKYKTEIVAAYPRIKEVEVLIPRYGLTLHPWEMWGNDANPLWWNAYNNVKHHRHTHFSEASLKHALNAVAGLFALILFYYREEAENGLLNPDPGLFRIGTPFFVNNLQWGNKASVYLMIGNGNG